MMKKLIAILFLFTASATSAFAADQGWYIGLDAGQSNTNTIPLSTSTGTAVDIVGGYQFTKYVGAEVTYMDLGSPTLALGQVGGGVSAKIDGYTLRAVGTYPFNDMWSIFGKLGAAHTKFGGNVGKTKNDVTYGVGGQYNFTPNWGVNVQYNVYSVEGPAPLNQKANSNVATIGVQYKF